MNAQIWPIAHAALAAVPTPNVGRDPSPCAVEIGNELAVSSVVEKLRATESADALYALLIEALPAQSAA